MVGISKKNKKTRRPLARDPFPLTGKQDSFKNVFPLGRNIKLAVARASENRKKYGFHQPENQFPLAGMENSFKNTSLF